MNDFNGTERQCLIQEKLYTIYNNVIPQRGRAIACTIFASRVVATVRRARFTMLFTIFLQTLCSLFFSFYYNIHTGMWVADSPLFWCYYSFVFRNVCQQLELPLFGCCGGSKCGSFFLLWGVWPGVAFIWVHWIGVARVGRVVRMTFIKDYQVKGARFKAFVIWVPRLKVKGH